MEPLGSRRMSIFIAVNRKEGPKLLSYVTLKWLTYRKRCADIFIPCGQLHSHQSNVTKHCQSIGIFLTTPFNLSISSCIASTYKIIFAFLCSCYVALGIIVTSFSKLSNKCWQPFKIWQRLPTHVNGSVALCMVARPYVNVP